MMERMDRPADRDGLTVGEVATMLGVTVRALHHWDAIGLARPSTRSAAGYRLYTTRDLDRLRRIVVYRELDVSLDRIRAILDGADRDVPASLRAQRADVDRRIARLQRLGDELDRMVEAHERGTLLSAAQQRSIFGPDWDPDGAAKARARFGDTTQWREHAERAATRGVDEWQATADEIAALELELATAMDDGVAPGDAEADRLVERHRQVVSEAFPITRQMQVCLVRMYESDAGFAAYYDRIRDGLAAWLRRCVDASARAHGIDPDTASWQ